MTHRHSGYVPHPSAQARRAAAWQKRLAGWSVAAAGLGFCASGAAVSSPAGVDAGSCIAPNTFMELTAQVAGTGRDAGGQNVVALGSYERFSPDGRFVLRSYSGAGLGNVSLMELPAFEGQVLRAYRTPFSNEAFPVQGSWRYLVDTDGAHYGLADVLQHERGARALFRGGMTGFYAAAAELPGEREGEIRIRSLSWPNSGGDEHQGEGALSARTLTVDTRSQRIVQDSGVQYLCGARVHEDGAMYALPMISVDGTEFAAMPQMPVQGQPTMRIFAFGTDGQGCHLQDTFLQASGKTVFGFADSAGGRAPLACEYRAQIWWYVRALHRAFNLAPPAQGAGDVLLASAFPGITRDGRVLYAATRRSCSVQGTQCTDRVGYMVADPWQSADFQAWRMAHAAEAAAQHFPRCVTREDVQRTRAEFARQRGLPGA